MKILKTFVSLGRLARPRLDHGARKGKGDDYQEVDVNAGKRLSHKNTKKGLTGTIFHCITSDRHVSDTLYLQYEMKILKNICVIRPTGKT